MLFNADTQLKLFHVAFIETQKEHFALLNLGSFFCERHKRTKHLKNLKDFVKTSFKQTEAIKHNFLNTKKCIYKIFWSFFFTLHFLYCHFTIKLIKL